MARTSECECSGHCFRHRWPCKRTEGLARVKIRGKNLQFCPRCVDGLASERERAKQPGMKWLKDQVQEDPIR